MNPLSLFQSTVVLVFCAAVSFANGKDTTVASREIGKGNQTKSIAMKKPASGCQTPLSQQGLEDLLVLAKAAASDADTAAKEAAVAAQQATEAVQAIAKQSPETYWARLDLSLDPSLAATLAGLALAAAAFLFSAEASIRSGTTKGIEAKINNAIDARRYLIWSFYGFLVALGSGIVIDPGQVLGESWSLLSLGELGFSGGGTVFGAFYLWKGARAIVKLEGPNN